MHSPSKRKRENDDDENPRKRSAVDNNLRGNRNATRNEQQDNRNMTMTEPENKNAGENVWEDDDDFDAILTQPENLNRLDNLIASSQMVEKEKKESTRKLTLPPIFIETDLGKEMFKDLNQQVTLYMYNLYLLSRYYNYYLLLLMLFITNNFWLLSVCFHHHISRLKQPFL